MSQTRSRLNRWAPVFIWASLIFLLSSISSLPSAQKFWWDFVFKKSAHMFEYAVLYFLLLRAFNKKGFKIYSLCFLLSFAYALSDEFHQSFTPGRTPHPMDVGFDTLGITLSHLRIKKII